MTNISTSLRIPDSLTMQNYTSFHCPLEAPLGFESTDSDSLIKMAVDATATFESTITPSPDNSKASNRSYSQSKERSKQELTIADMLIGTIFAIPYATYKTTAYGINCSIEGLTYIKDGLIAIVKEAKTKLN